MNIIKSSVEEIINETPGKKIEVAGSQRKDLAKKVEIVSKKVWTSSHFCGIVVC